MEKVILITGASSGFGLTTAQYLINKGYTVYGTSRKLVNNNNINMLQMDVCNKESITKAVNYIIEKEGSIDVVINNAGVGVGGSIELATEDEISLQMNTNFMGMANVCSIVLPFFRKQRYGKIINISSIGGIMGLPYQGFYSASKFAIEGYSEALAAEVKGFGIKVILVEPGDFSTNFTANRKKSFLTLQNNNYKESFLRSLKIIEKEENGGLKPIILAKKIEKIIKLKNPRFRYVVANLEQKLSVILKRIIPGNLFINILRDYYKV
jgi:short-subunit dehydrogenase